jgi:hypothetical protein
MIITLVIMAIKRESGGWHSAGEWRARPQPPSWCCPVPECQKMLRGLNEYLLKQEVIRHIREHERRAVTQELRFEITPEDRQLLKEMNIGWPEAQQ